MLPDRPGDAQQNRRRLRPTLAAAAAGDLSQDHRRTQRTLRRVIVRLHHILPQEPRQFPLMFLQPIGDPPRGLKVPVAGYRIALSPAVNEGIISPYLVNAPIRLFAPIQICARRRQSADNSSIFNYLTTLECNATPRSGKRQNDFPTHRNDFFTCLSNFSARLNDFFTCPNHSDMCPEHSGMCPSRSDMCPDHSDTCPNRADTCPNHSGTCPNRLDTCPNRPDTCPNRSDSCRNHSSAYRNHPSMC